jgi:electron transfer flavoprotein alpha subunit
MNASQSWIVVADDTVAAELVEHARTLSTHVVAVVAGRRCVADTVAHAVDRVIWLGELADAPVEAFAPAVAGLVAQAAPTAVIGATTPGGRALLGAVAARLQSPVIGGIGSVELEGGRVVVTRSMFGGVSEQRVSVEGGTAVLAVESRSRIEATGSAVPVEEVPVTPLGTARIVDVTVKEHVAVNLDEAKIVVAVGRGLKAQADVALLQALAEAFGGELGCSRPLAEGVDWIAKERYVGISGQHIAPDLYVAVGISGQLQHMVGVRDAKVIVAVNSDKAAPIFSQCDFGIVGDLYQVVPALTAALRGTA